MYLLPGSVIDINTTRRYAAFCNRSAMENIHSNISGEAIGKFMTYITIILIQINTI